MKVAHFGNFAPYGCGMFHTICDLIEAERSVGIDAQFIDWSLENPVRGQFYSRVGLRFGDIVTITPEWAKESDILVRHSAIPGEIKALGTPIVMMIHGRPEYDFMLEYTGRSVAFSLMQKYASDSQYKTFLVLGEMFVDTWKYLLETEAKIEYLPLMIDLGKFNPRGPKQSFEGVEGRPNIIIADRWREDTTPFYLLIAAAKFKEKVPTAKLHCFGLPHPKNDYISALVKPLMRKGVIGKAFTAVENMDKIYRAADFLLSPNNSTNRVVREALASGCPVIAAPGCKYTKYTAYPGDIDGCVEVMMQLWNDIQANPEGIREEARKVAEENFSMKRTGETLRRVYEKVLEET